MGLDKRLFEMSEVRPFVNRSWKKLLRYRNGSVGAYDPLVTRVQKSCPGSKNAVMESLQVEEESYASDLWAS
jgi:hypothetical protein